MLWHPQNLLYIAAYWGAESLHRTYCTFLSLSQTKFNSASYSSLYGNALDWKLIRYFWCGTVRVVECFFKAVVVQIGDAKNHLSSLEWQIYLNTQHIGHTCPLFLRTGSTMMMGATRPTQQPAHGTPSYEAPSATCSCMQVLPRPWWWKNKKWQIGSRIRKS